MAHSVPFFSNFFARMKVGPFVSHYKSSETQTSYKTVTRCTGLCPIVDYYIRVNQNQRLNLMATRARIGYVLKDDSIVSVYHHWDGYPEWLGNILNKHYNEDEKVRELIDGGNMSSCYTNTDDETGEIVEPHVNYYGGDDEAPRHFQTLSALTDYDCGEEFLYLWFMNTWNCYAYKKTYDDEYNTVSTTLSPVIIPDTDANAEGVTV